MLLVQAQLISEVSQECVVKYLEEWLSRGRQYLRLAEKLDGAGALIFLPLWGESTWYHHCHAGGSDGHELVTLLEARGVMQDASEQRHNGRNAYGVVDQLFQGLLNRGGASFIPDGPIASSRGQGPLGKRVRGSRMSSRREPFSRVPSSPPTIEQQAVEDWPPQRPMDPSLAWCSDATSGCSAGDNSPLTVSSRDDNCHIWHVPSQPIV